MKYINFDTTMHFLYLIAKDLLLSISKSLPNLDSSIIVLILSDCLGIENPLSRKVSPCDLKVAGQLAKCIKGF